MDAQTSASAWTYAFRTTSPLSFITGSFEATSTCPCSTVSPTATWAFPCLTIMLVMVPLFSATRSQGLSSFWGMEKSTSFSFIFMRSLVPDTLADTQVISGKRLRIFSSSCSQEIPFFLMPYRIPSDSRYPKRFSRV